MKKIILLLTVLTLGVIACDKNELGMDMDGSSINPIEVKVDDSFARNTMIDILFGGVADAAPIVKGHSASTAKGSDYIAAYILVKDGVSYIVLVDESNDDLCFGEQSVSTAYVNHIGNGIAHIEDALENTTKDLGPGYESLFTSSLNEITELDFNGANLIVATAQFNDDNEAVIN